MTEFQFIQQSLISNLFFLRTIREFCANIQLSFFKNNLIYITAANELALECEELGRQLTIYADKKLSQEVLDAQIFYTNYTLACELLTEELFDIKIATDITKKQMELTAGTITIFTPELIKSLEDINIKALDINKRFTLLCMDIYNKQHINKLFSYSYPAMILYMMEEMKVYKQELERLIAKDSLDPNFVINSEYWLLNNMQMIAKFLKGLVNPENKNISYQTEYFILEFNKLVIDYKNKPFSPDSQRALRTQSISLVAKFQIFLSNTIKDLLSTQVYFIVEPIFLDNMYTEANYCQFILKFNQNIDLLQNRFYKM